VVIVDDDMNFANAEEDGLTFGGKNVRTEERHVKPALNSLIIIIFLL
jgi:hypothetical protein